MLVGVIRKTQLLVLNTLQTTWSDEINTSEILRLTISVEKEIYEAGDIRQEARPCIPY